MNYLAHAYLSFNQPPILVGNMISDYVKGKKKFLYDPTIQQGIQLHRIIDEFTDHHPATDEAKKFFKADYRLYAGAFVDVVYDHFLACDEKQFDVYGNLEMFSRNVYHSLELNFVLFPARFQNMFSHMKLQNWLYNYRLKKGIQNKEIAEALFISPKTVDHHISSILFKLDVNSRSRAVSEAARLGIAK